MLARCLKKFRTDISKYGIENSSGENLLGGFCVLNCHVVLIFQDKWMRPGWKIGWSLRWIRRCMANLFSDERKCFQFLCCCAVKGVEMSCKFFKRDRLRLWWFSLSWSMSNSISFHEDTNRTILCFSRDHKISYVKCVAQNHQKILDFRGSQQFFAERSRPDMCNPRPAA